MDIESIFDSKQINNITKDELIKQRNKAIAHCINLECKNEQLKLLMDKLQKMACAREDLLSNDENKNFVYGSHYLKSNKFKILSELKEAGINREKLEKNISNLKSKIFYINEKISNK